MFGKNYIFKSDIVLFSLPIYCVKETGILNEQFIQVLKSLMNQNVSYKKKKCSFMPIRGIGLLKYAVISVKIKLSLYLTNWALRHEGVCRSGYIDPRFLDLDTSWRWVVSFMPRPLYPRTNILRYRLDRSLCGPRKRSGRRGEEKNLTLTGTRTPTHRPSSPYQVAIPTAQMQIWSRFSG
jgi:hypothetical protein